jgi:hypothetical protein
MWLYGNVVQHPVKLHYWICRFGDTITVSQLTYPANHVFYP